MSMFNPAVEALNAPPVSTVLDWKASYDGRHGDMIDMSQAVPGYPAHPDMLSALAKAAAMPDNARYGRVEGDDNLRTAYAQHLSALYSANIAPEHTHITSGCNQAFVAAALAIAGRGERILMMRPCYFNHESSLGMLGISIGYVDCHDDNGLLPDCDDIAAAITADVRAIALVSPNNPAGTIYPPALLAEILALCKAKGIWLILDETYRDFLPVDAGAPHDLFATDSWQDHLIQLYSFSKSYCMPGHRLGAVVAGTDMVFQLAKIIDNIQICAPRAPQQAITPMLAHLASWRDENRARIAARATVFSDVINQLNGWELISTGAYFGYVRHPFDGIGSREVAQRMARDVGVLTIPGAFFGDGQEQYLRFAFANAGRKVIGHLAARLGLLA
jgi:aspartate/methionine/tyrosine aminotransferase